MSYRKVNDNSLASVADAIRSKGGTSNALVFPDGFVSAISAIQTGGGAPSLQSKSVTYTKNGTATITPDEGYDGLSSVDVTVGVESGGGGAGFSVTFPATANNWVKVSNYATLVLSDGSTVDFKDYSVVAGRTINNVIDILASATYNYVLRLTLTAGAVVVTRIRGVRLDVVMIEAPGTTPFYYATRSSDMSFMPVEDIIISAIDVIDTSD